MDGIGRRLRQRVYSAKAVERFVQVIVTGGISLIGGLWLARLSPFDSTGWWIGVGLVAVGIGALAWGIGSEVEY